MGDRVWDIGVIGCMLWDRVWDLWVMGCTLWDRVWDPPVASLSSKLNHLLGALLEKDARHHPEWEAPRLFNSSP